MPVEPRDIVLADQDRQRVGDLIHADAQLAGFGAIDRDSGLGAVKGEIAVHVGKQSAGARGALDALHRLVERGEILRRANHHLHR